MSTLNSQIPVSESDKGTSFLQPKKAMIKITKTGTRCFIIYNTLLFRLLLQCQYYLCIYLIKKVADRVVKPLVPYIALPVVNRTQRFFIGDPYRKSFNKADTGQNIVSKVGAFQRKRPVRCFVITFIIIIDLEKDHRTQL